MSGCRCVECKFRNTSGFVKVRFMPLSVFSAMLLTILDTKNCQQIFALYDKDIGQLKRIDCKCLPICLRTVHSEKQVLLVYYHQSFTK